MQYIGFAILFTIYGGELVLNSILKMTTADPSSDDDFQLATNEFDKTSQYAQPFESKH